MMKSWQNITLTTVNTPRACLPFLSLICVMFLSSTTARLSCTQNKKVNMVAATCSSPNGFLVFERFPDILIFLIKVQVEFTIV